MSEFNIAYVRVSSIDQNEARQIEFIKSYLSSHNLGVIDRWFVESASAKDTNRPIFQEMISFVRSGDKIFIEDFSRISRNTNDLLQIVSFVKEKNITLISCKEDFINNSPTGEFMLTMIGAINEFERKLILERQKEGIAIAKAAGKYKGRGRKKYDKRLFNYLYFQYQNGEISKRDFEEQLAVSRPTLNKIIREYEASKAENKQNKQNNKRKE